jgi:serine/threonine-protein kinase
MPVGADSSSAYLSAGLSDGLIRVLGRIPGLRVAGRASSFALAARGADARTAGRQLGVGAVLDGEIRPSGDRRRILVRLLSVEEGFDLWSEVYELRDSSLFDVEDRIARSVVGALRLRNAPNPPALPDAPARDPVALAAYLRARVALDVPGGGGYGAAIPELERALALDSGFALAHAALADALLRLGTTDSLPPREVMPRAEAAAARALALDTALVEAHTTLGAVRFLYRWDWGGAEEELRRAIGLNPSWAPGYLWYARQLIALGRGDEALAEVRRAIELDPLSFEAHLELGRQHYFARDSGAARQALRHADRLLRDAWEPSAYLGLTAVAVGDTAEAVARLEEARRRAPDRVEPLAGWGLAAARAGRASEAGAVLDDLRDLAPRRYVSPCLLGYVSAALGDKRAAFAWLDRAVRDRASLLVYLRRDPRTDPLRADPRFTALLRRVGLP